jgi:hypothetical protein
VNTFELTVNNASADYNYALYLARSNGHQEVVQCLKERFNIE